MSRSVDIGTKAATAVCRAAQTNGFPHAERRDEEGEHDRGDVAGMLGLCVQVKGGQAAKTASPGQILKWMREVDKQTANANADLGFLVRQRRGQGLPNAHLWPAHLWSADYRRLIDAPSLDLDVAARFTPEHLIIEVTFAHLLTLLRASGYGDPL